MTRWNRSKSGPIGTIRVSSTPFWMPSETRAEVVDRLGHGAEPLAALADQVELVLDRPEVLAEPAELRRPARSTAPSAAPPRIARPSRPRAMLSSRSRRVGREELGVRAAEQLLQAAGDLEEPGLVDHQLAGQVHQLVEPVDVDPDRLGDLRGRASAAAAHRRAARPRRGGPAGRSGSRGGPGSDGSPRHRLPVPAVRRSAPAAAAAARGRGLDRRISATPSTSARACSSSMSHSAASQTVNCGSVSTSRAARRAGRSRATRPLAESRFRTSLAFMSGQARSGSKISVSRTIPDVPRRGSTPAAREPARGRRAGGRAPRARLRLRVRAAGRARSITWPVRPERSTAPWPPRRSSAVVVAEGVEAAEAEVERGPVERPLAARGAGRRRSPGGGSGSLTWSNPITVDEPLMLWTIRNASRSDRVVGRVLLELEQRVVEAAICSSVSSR